jgi:YggT family protein
MGTAIYVIYVLLLVYIWLIVARVVLSWFTARLNSPIYHIKRALFRLTEPYVGLFRRFLPMKRVGNVLLDLSALLALVILFVVVQVLTRV